MAAKPSPRRSSVLASVLAAASIALAVASCSHITPLGPDSMQLSPQRHLGSPIIVQVMRVQPPTATGRCPAGWVAVSLPAGGGPRPVATRVHVLREGAPASPAPPPPPTSGTCYRPAGTPVTITSAAVSSVLTYRPPPGQAKGPDSYGFIVAVPGADVAAVTAVIRQAYDTRSAVGISVAGKLWQAPMVVRPFPGQQFQIQLLSRNQALQLHRQLVPPS
jgi:hypothetical protein